MPKSSTKVFIGYSLLDRDYVAELASFLSTNGFATWSQGARDFGKDWRPAIRRELESSDALLVVRSRRSAYGIWIYREIAWARELRIPIFVLQIDGPDMAALPGATMEDGRDYLMPSSALLRGLASVRVGSASEHVVQARTRYETVGRTEVIAEVPGLHRGPITEIAVSPSDRSVTTVSMDATVKVTDILGRRTLASREISLEWLWSVDLDPAGDCVAVCGNDGVLRVIASSGEGAILGSELRLTSGEWLLCVRFSPDGSQLAVAGFDGNVTVWRVDDWTVSYQLSGDGDWLYAVAWSPCGQRIAAAGEGGVIFVWTAPWDSPHVELHGHSERLFGLEFSPDGRWLFSASGDTTLRVWETSSSSTRQIWKGHTGWVLAVKLSPDGRYALSTSNDGTARLWPVAFDDFVSHPVQVGGWVTSGAWLDSSSFVLGTSEGDLYVYAVVFEDGQAAEAAR